MYDFAFLFLYIINILNSVCSTKIKEEIEYCTLAIITAVCISFTPFFIAVYIVERLKMQSGYYFMILSYLIFILRTPSKTEQKIEMTTFLLYICTYYIIAATAVFTAERFV